jgi:hypothetical protein
MHGEYNVKYILLSKTCYTFRHFYKAVIRHTHNKSIREYKQFICKNYNYREDSLIKNVLHVMLLFLQAIFMPVPSNGFMKNRNMRHVVVVIEVHLFICLSIIVITS